MINSGLTACICEERSSYWPVGWPFSSRTGVSVLSRRVARSPPVSCGSSVATTRSMFSAWRTQAEAVWSKSAQNMETKM